MNLFRLFFVFSLSTLLFSENIYALKILGSGSKDHDVVFLGTPLSVHTFSAREPADAVEGSPEDPELRHMAVFKIDRVLVGAFKKKRRGGPSRYDQMTEAMKNKEVLDVVGFNFKNPEDEIERDTVRIAVKDAGSTFGLVPGEPLAYFQHKIYLKRLSRKSETFLFLKSEPVREK